MNISAWSIRHPVPAVLLFALLTFLGLRAFGVLGIQNFPDIDFPVVTVNAGLEGATPSQMESEVARKIENKLAALTGVRHIYSTLTEGSASLQVEFVLEKDINEALDDVRNAVDSVRSDLPSDMTTPTVAKVETTGTSIITYALTSTHRSDEALSWFIDDTVARALLAVPGVGAVTREGGVEREILVELDPDRLNAYNLTAATVSSQLRLTQSEPSGGRGDVGGQRQSIRTLAMSTSASALAAREIPLGDGRRVRLDELATVRDTVEEPTGLVLFDGKQVVGFGVTRSRGASEVSVADGVRAAVATLRTQHPDITFTEAYDTVGEILDAYHGSMHLLYEGAFLAMAVVLLFVGNWRATLIAATALPFSIIPTFLVMSLLGFNLNTISLLALALVVGVLVDDAIVEIENIDRHLRMKKSPFQAAMEAADEIGLAVVATTFTLVAVFLPTAFMGGIPGKIFSQFGWTAGVAVLFSLLVARLLTPMLAAYLLKAIPHEPRDGMIMRGYLSTSRWCLNHRWWTLSFAGLFFVGSLALTPLLSTTFFPASDDDHSSISIELAPGSTLAQTRAVTEQVDAVVRTLPDVQHVFASVGGGGDTRSATLSISLQPRAQRTRSQTAIETELRERLPGLPGVRLNIGGGQSGETLTLVLAGNDQEALLSAVQAVQRDLRTLPGLGTITSDASLLSPEVHIIPDPARAADLGVTTAALMNAVQVATAGDFAPQLAKLNLTDRQLAVRVRLSDAARSDLDTLARLRVPGANGNVLLGAVADIRMGSGPARIDRLDRERRVSISVGLNGQQLGDVYDKVNRLPALTNLPSGVTRSSSGEAEFMEELFGSFGSAMAVGIICIYIVLVLLFHDFLQPITILAALPLATGGALLALLIGGFPFSMPSIIGLLMLMGIVTKNSILLVDYAVMARREHNLSRFDALVDACHKRARPIVMTTLAMGVGMLPIALGWGADPSFRAPMATAVIGGLITSTLLSLLVVPVVFTITDDVGSGLRRMFRRFSTRS